MSRTNLTEPTAPLPVRRAALYIRVSTDEQARKGYSLPAQREALEDYARKNGYAIVDVYIDDGVSAHQVYTKRKGLMRLLNDVRAGKIDTVLFIKLDRWFRNIKEYYKVQEILDGHNVAWKAILEDYETETSQGNMVTNIMLSVAQAESDRTSDRIKFVFENKVARGEVLSGKTPFGYKIENKRLVPDENADAARDMFKHYAETHSITSTMRYMRDTYGATMHQTSTRVHLTNPLYKGEYRSNPNYCEPLISPEEFDAVQELIKRRSTRINPTGRVYLFPGLLYCSECGHAMVAHYISEASGRTKQPYVYYRCQQHALYHKCAHKASITESRLEDWLLLNISSSLEETKDRWLMAAKGTSKPKTDRAAILRKMDKLKELYVNDLITMEQYRVDYQRYQDELAKIAATADAPTPDYDELQRLLDDQLAAYKEMDRAGRRAFWSSIIEKIELDADNTPTIYFARSCTN